MLPYGLFNLQEKMESKYFQRAILWIRELLVTLLKFWIKNPQETPTILGFMFEKIVASPRFLARNVLTEKYSLGTKESLRQTSKLYQKFGESFDPADKNSYKQLEDNLTSKSQILYFLVRKIKPAKVLETGVAAGESTAYILQAIKDNKKGKLYSIDLPFQWYIYGNHKLHLDSLPAGKMPGYLIPENLKKNWTLILGNTYEKLPPLLKKLKQIDIFFHDSEHSDKAMMFEYTQAWPTIKRGGYLLSDDIGFTKAFNKFTKSKKITGITFKDLGVAKK